MNFLNIFEDHVAGIFGATRAPFSFKKLAKQAARDMEDQTLVINGVNTAPALYTILIAADDDPMLAPFYPELSREVREFVKAQAEKRRYVFGTYSATGRARDIVLCRLCQYLQLI